MRSSTHLAVCALALLIAAGGAGAQSGYPEKPIRIVAPFPPGGAADILARALAQKLNESFARSAFVENRPGAGGTIGSDVVAKSTPDGYTLLLGNVSTLATAPGLYARLPYDPARDFAPVTLVAKSPLVFTVHPSVPVKSLKELIALARSRPGKLTYGSSGAGSITHLTGELMAGATKASMVHVPYKGAAPVIVALVSGEIDMGVLQVVEMVPYYRSGRLKPLAVSGTSRAPAVPELPYAGELGIAGLEATTWYCVVGPRGIPQPVVNALNGVLVKAITSPDLNKRFTADGLIAESSTPDELARLIRGEIGRWAEVVKRTGVKLD